MKTYYIKSGDRYLRNGSGSILQYFSLEVCEYEAKSSFTGEYEIYECNNETQELKKIKTITEKNEKN